MDSYWKDIPGFEGFYQVNDQGGVRSLPRSVWVERLGKKKLVHHKGRVLVISHRRFGESPSIRLSKNGVVTEHTVSSLQEKAGIVSTYD